MANNEFTIPIPARLKNVAKGGHVAGAKDIIDDALGKEQSEINKDRIDDIVEVKGGSTKSIADLSEDIANEAERASGVEAGLRESIDELGQIGLNPDNAISTDGDDFDGDTTAKRSKVPTIGAIIDGNLGVYDVSKRNPTAGPNSDGKFTLEYILSHADTLIPTSRRHGGMEICFVHSSDNKYVQYRLMSLSFSINPNDWEEVGNTSKELTQEFEQGVSYIVGPNQTKYSKYLTADYCAILFPVNSGEEYSINGIGGGSLRLWATCSEDGTIRRRSDADIDRSTTSGLTETVTIEDGESILIVNSTTNSVITNHTSKVIVNTQIPSVIKNTRDELHEKYNNISEELSTKIDKNSGFLFIGFVDPSSQPTVDDPTCRYCYIANTPGTYTNCGGLVVNKGEICIFRRTYYPSQVVWQKSLVARQGDAIIAAYDAPAEWKAIATSNAASVTDGLSTIYLYLNNKATDGDTIILSPGTFSSVNSGVQIDKSINIVGQGKSTVLSRGDSWAEMWIESDGVNVSVRNVNIANFIRINAKSETEFYDSKLYLENIYLNGEPLDTDLINYVYKKRVPTLAISNSPYRWYATANVVQGTPADSISAFTYGTSKLPASYDIKKRTVLLLPGNYKGTGAVYLGKTYPIALVGVPGHEKETIIHRTNKPANQANDIFADGGGNVISNYELRVENITVKEMINFQYCTNFHMINCWRDGIRLEDYDGGNSVGVGKNQIFLRLSYALDVVKTIAQPTNRYTIDIYGETEEIMTPIGDTAGIDIEGHDKATVLKIGYEHGGNPYGLAGALNVKDNWDGTIRNVTFKIAGVFIGKNFSAFQIVGGNCQKGRFENIKCYNLTFPGKGVPANPSLPWDESTNAVKFHFDPENRMVICNSDTNSSTGYTAHVYSPIFGTEVGTYECTAEEAAKTNFYLLAIRKPDSEMRQHPDDPGGSRRYGLYVSCSNECDIIFTNCEGYGSPWGFHNTRGIYVDYGSPKLFNCIGVSGGIGFNLHGIICHRRSEAELVGCIGFASPFAYYGNGLNIDNFGGSGIKFQAASCAKLVGCIGYANDQQYSNGILCDYKTHPRLINCVGYNGGGEDTAGFALYDCASVDLVGGYYGKRLHNSTKLFEHESGSNGMVYYPYKRPVRLDSTEDEVIYGDHWKETLDVTDKPYRIESLSFDQSGIGELINDYLCFYDVDETTSEKTLIGKGSFTSIGDFQMANFVPYQTGNQHYDMEVGHHLYICIEDANGNELSSHSGVIRPIVTTSELGTRSSGVYIKQYWVINWGSPQPDPTAPDIVIPDDALLSGLEAYDNNWSLRIGENADIAHRYVVANATLKGDLERDVPTVSEPRIYNSVKIISDTVTII